MFTLCVYDLTFILGWQASDHSSRLCFNVCVRQVDVAASWHFISFERDGTAYF